MRPPLSPARFIHLACALGVLGLNGCGWTARSPVAPTFPQSARAEGGNWWREVGGATLDAFVNEALKNSPAIEVLAARVKVARADARLLAASSSQPTVSAQSARQFGDRREFETGGERASVMRYTGQASFAWELDFWGRVNQLRKGARRQVEAALAMEQAGRLLLISEIARLDLSRRRLGAEEKVIADTLAANGDIVRRLREKQSAGIIDASTVDRQVAEGEFLRREIEESRRQRRLAELALDRLIGRPPGRIPWPSAPAMAHVPPLPEVVPTELLARRPDLRAAAARVAATWHLSMAASLDLLPKLQFTGLAAGRTMRLSPSIEEWVAQIAPSLEIPLWDPDRQARAGQGKAQATLAAAEYRDIILRALEETEAALVDVAAQGELLQSARASADSLNAVFERTREKFRRGVVSQLEVLEDQRRSLQSERTALGAREARMAAWIDLKKALGG